MLSHRRITGGRDRAFETLEETGLDAALGVDDIPDKLEYLVKGYRNPSEYFNLFRNSMLVRKDSHVWFRNKVVTLFDDHDQGFVFEELAKLTAVRRSRIALRRGRQYLREISGDGMQFGLPQMIGGQIRSVVPWSRIHDDSEILCAINTDYNQPLSAWVTIDDELHQAGHSLTCLYSTVASEIGGTINAERRNGKSVWLTVPAAGFVIYE